MRAAVFHGPNNITNEDVFYRSEEDKEVILSVNACAICGYDVRVFRHGHQKVTPPIILGHEICARTDRDISIQTPMTAIDNKITSSSVVKIKAGSRVAVSPIIPCLNCIYCNS